MRQQEGLTIVEALENLNVLSDIDSLDEIEVSDKSILISHKSEQEGTKKGKEIYWVHGGTDDQTIHAIRETFKSVYEYLRTSFDKLRGTSDTRHLVEGINTIMILVDEAAKKLERFGAIFARVTELNEYKRLEAFYRNKVVKESYKDFVRTPIPEKPEGLTEEEILLQEELAGLLPQEAKGVFPLNDLEVVKKDSDYELFNLKNEDGRNFYTYDLARNIKLACDFGEFQEEYFGQDPLLQIKSLIDKNHQLAAQNILQASKKEREKFHKQAGRYRGLEVVDILNKALMALMLAANPKNLIRQFSLKGCYRYFNDFQMFLRQALLTKEYQKLIIYSAPSSQEFFVNLVELVEKICIGLFTLGGGTEEIKKVLIGLNNREAPEKVAEESLATYLQKRNKVLTQVLKRHPSGPIFKAVDLVREEEERTFDPIFQENLPDPEYTFTKNGKTLTLLRLPSPTLQEFIAHAEVTPEFKEFLRGYQKEGKKHLLINLQERTSWKEHARALAIEELSRHAQFDRSLTVITLASDTDFYHQEGIYATLDNAEEFKSQFFDHISDEASGYYYSQKIKKALFPAFMETVIKDAHETYFGNKTTLNQEERKEFIDLCYLRLVLKAIEITEPSSLSFTSKDGLDLAACSNVAFIAFYSTTLKFSEKEKEELERILFGETLLMRERNILPERFHRLIRFLKLVEAKSPKRQGKK